MFACIYKQKEQKEKIEAMTNSCIHHLKKIKTAIFKLKSIKTPFSQVILLKLTFCFLVSFWVKVINWKALGGTLFMSGNYHP